MPQNVTINDQTTIFISMWLSMKRKSFITHDSKFVSVATNVTFLKNLQKFHSQHLVIGYLVRHSGKNELHELSDIL